MKRRRPAALAVIFILLVPTLSAAEWVQDGILIAAQPGDETGMAAIPDETGGLFLAWLAPVLGNYYVYAQRLAPDGTEMWGAGGVIVCDVANSQWGPVLAPDGAGGVVLCWQDERNGSGNADIYAQRLDDNGNNLWAANGTPICDAADLQTNPDVHFDGGAFLVAWEDERAGQSDVYVQRVDLNGNDLWAANGVAAVNLAGSGQSGPVVVGNGSSGAIVAWSDNRSGFSVYVQSVNFFGTPVWTTGGIRVAPTGTQLSPTLAEDGAGGAFVGFRDDTGATSDIQVQHRDAAGAELWTTSLTHPVSNSYLYSMATDGGGGVFVAFTDDRDDFADIYAQRVNTMGVPLWQEYGAPVSVAAEAQSNPAIIADGTGGAVVAWGDNRFQGTDIYTQRVTAYGTAMWASNGVPVSTAPSFQENFILAGNGSGGGYLVWRDIRSGDRNVYAQRIEPNYGAWGQPEPSIASVTDDPDDQGGDVALNWYASERDQFLHPEVTHYSMWRAIDAVTAGAMVTAALGDISPGFKKPVIRRQSTAAGDYFWELLGTQIALRSSGYSYLAETRDDSTGTDPAVHYFQVVAHTSNANVFYVSDAASGYSVDNLAPASPIMLVAERVGNYVRLHWMPGTDEDEPDFDTYAVYRDLGPGVVPEPVYYLNATEDTTLWDQTVDPGRPYYYIVTAIDIHENQSAPSNTANVSATVTGAGDPPALTSLQVRGNFPNPFGGATELQIGLPDRSDVSVDVFDVRGRRVAGVSQPAMAAGWGSVRFDGRDDTGAFLPSGVYFYRVSAGGETTTRKLVIQR